MGQAPKSGSHATLAAQMQHAKPDEPTMPTWHGWKAMPLDTIAAADIEPGWVLYLPEERPIQVSTSI